MTDKHRKITATILAILGTIALVAGLTITFTERDPQPEEENSRTVSEALETMNTDEENTPTNDHNPDTNTPNEEEPTNTEPPELVEGEDTPIPQVEGDANDLASERSNQGTTHTFNGVNMTVSNIRSDGPDTCFDVKIENHRDTPAPYTAGLFISNTHGDKNAYLDGKTTLTGYKVQPGDTTEGVVCFPDLEPSPISYLDPGSNVMKTWEP